MTPELAARLEDRTIVASCSGGKDSTALSLHLKELGLEHLRVFADTKWEHESLYAYLRGPLTAALGPIHEVGYPGGMEQLIRDKASFPARAMRHCTENLKVVPIAKFIDSLDTDVVNAVGVRAEESKARSIMPEWEWSDATDCWVWRPLIAWSEQNVIDIILRHGLTPWSGYIKHGLRRAGCWPCIYVTKEELRIIAELSPERIDQIERLERDVEPMVAARLAAKGETFASKGWTPPTFFSGRSNVSATYNNPIREMVAWARTDRGGRQLPLIREVDPDAGCMRWGLCEHSAKETK